MIVGTWYRRQTRKLVGSYLTKGLIEYFEISSPYYYYAFNNSMANTEPPSAGRSNQTLPFISSIYRFTSERPRPLELSPPVGLTLNLENFLKSILSSSTGTPGPLSLTLI